MEMDIYKQRSITNNNWLCLYLLRMCNFRTAKFGLVVFSFSFRVWWASGPSRYRYSAILDCLVLHYISLNVSGPTAVASRTRDEASRRDETRRDETRRDETRRGGPHERAIHSRLRFHYPFCGLLKRHKPCLLVTDA